MGLGRDLRIGIGYLVSVYTGNWVYLAAALNNERVRTKTDIANRRAREQYNNSLADRLEMIERDPRLPRTRAYGRVRAVEGLHRPWTTGADSQYLILPVSFAGHQIDGFEQWYLDDTLVTLDGSGYVQTAPYYRVKREQSSVSGTLDGSGGATIALGATPVGGTVYATWATGSGESMVQGSASVSVVGSTATVTGGQPGAAVTVTFARDVGTSYVRIRPYLGTSGQNVGSDLAAEYPGKITSNDRAAGVALAIVECRYDPDIFPQGRPTPTAVFRGAKLYDPRKDSTVSGGSGSHRINDETTWEWSQNPALIAYDYARYRFGWNVPASKIRVADVIAAANACDVSTVFTLRKSDGTTSTVTLPRYRCSTVIPTDADPMEAMASIAATMAGRVVWTGSGVRMRAGKLSATSLTIDESWLSQERTASGGVDEEPVISGVQSVTRSQRWNRVSGSCVDPDQRYQMLPFPAVEDSVLIADKGERATEVQLDAVDHIAHAQNLARITIREAQASSTFELRCGLRALRAELLDVAAITLSRFGMSGKTCEVVGWRWDLGTIRLRLNEITDAIYDPSAELKGRDPAPDSDIRRPWEVEQIGGVSVTSGTTPTLDGSIITRTVVTWTAANGANIRQGGDIEVQYTEATGVLPTGEWSVWPEAGGASTAIIPGLLAGRYYLFRVRAVQRVPYVRGLWSTVVRHKVAAAPTGSIVAAQAAADAAAAEAATANATLANIASDSLLTPDEKPSIILDRDVILAEQSDIDAKATAQGITTLKTTYDNAVAALTTYLATLTTPVLWSNLSGNTTIVGTTFRSKFGDVYAARQALLNSIAVTIANAAVGTDQIAVGATKQVFTTTGSSAVSVTANAFSPDDYVRNTQVTTVTFTAAANGEAVVYIDARGTYTNGSGVTATGRWSIQLDGGTWDSWKRISAAVPSGATSYQFPIQSTRRFNVLQGVTYSFSLYACKFGGSDTFSIDGHELTAEVTYR